MGPGETLQPGTWLELTDNYGLANIESLVAAREDHLWALDTNGEVFQLSTLNLADPDAPQVIFEPQSEGLGVGPLSDFTIDESGVLYGVSGNELELVQTQSTEIQTFLSDKTAAVALGTDSEGRVHYAFSTDEGVYHSYLRDGAWINAQFIPGSSLASEISIDFDAKDDVYISWVQSVGNAPLAGTALVDGIGNAIAAVDLNGDGLRDLVLGAPLASIADANGQQTFTGSNAGRIYVLFARGRCVCRLKPERLSTP